jgi:hypothetical protein
MGRTLDEIIATLPKARRDCIEARYRVLSKETEHLVGPHKGVKSGNPNDA